MRNSTMALVLIVLGSLHGCSSKPDVSDIATELNSFWGTCAKVSDLVKTNGVANGNIYRMSYSYKLQALGDSTLFPHEPREEKCSFAQNTAWAKIGGLSAIKRGDIHTVSNETNMVKSEKGWISQ